MSSFIIIKESFVYALVSESPDAFRLKNIHVGTNHGVDIDSIEELKSFHFSHDIKFTRIDSLKDFTSTEVKFTGPLGLKKIESLIDRVFPSLELVEKYIKSNNIQHYKIVELGRIITHCSVFH